MDFERILEQCSYEIQVRYKYMGRKLGEIEDAILDFIEQIEENKVDIELIRRMDSGMESESVLLELENERLEDRIKFLEEQEHYLEDMFDEEYFRIIA